VELEVKKPTESARGKIFQLRVPFDDLLGLRVEHWEKGRARVTVATRPDLMNAKATVHGGVLVALLDVALATAAHAHVDDTETLITVNLSVSFLSAGTGTLVAEGRLIKRGGSLAFCEGEVRGEDGELVAKAVGTFKVPRRADAGQTRAQ